MAPEDWSGIAAEVEVALQSIGDTSQPNGYPATLRKPAGSAPVNPWDPPAGDPAYHQVIVMVSDKELRDVNGTLIGMTKRTVTISGAAGVVPSDDDKIVLGMTKAEVETAGDAEVSWLEIERVEPLAPAGIAVLYTIDLVT